MMPIPPKPSSARQRAQGLVSLLQARMRKINDAWRVLHNEEFPMSDDIYSRLYHLEKELRVVDFDKETFPHETEAKGE